MSRRNMLHLILAGFCLATAPALVAAQATNYVAGALIQLNDNGAWSWFMDERAIVTDGKLVVGSVRSVGGFSGTKGDPNWGNLEVSVYDLATGTTQRTILHQHFEQDDHDSPAFVWLPDRRLLALYSKHGQERKVYCRSSEAGNPLTWGPATEFVTPGKYGPPFKADNVTHNNLFRLPRGRLYNFYRGVHLEPNYLVSDDSGQTWKYGGHFLSGKGGYSPYLRYAFDGKETIHFIATEDHPRNYPNSVYHGFLREGRIHRSDGTGVLDGWLRSTRETKSSGAFGSRISFNIMRTSPKRRKPSRNASSAVSKAPTTSSPWTRAILPRWSRTRLSSIRA